jgi:hypothetical protein
LLRQLIERAFSFALLKAGSNIAASKATIAITTKSSIKVNANLIAFRICSSLSKGPGFTALLRNRVLKAARPLPFHR